MLVRSQHTTLNALRRESNALSSELDRWWGRDTKALDLTAGKTYVVYAVGVEDGWLFYYVAPDSYDADMQYPHPYHAALFDVVEARVSTEWVLGVERVWEPIRRMLMTFPEWAMDHPGFYARLVDGSDSEIEIFRKYKETMDREEVGRR